MIADATDPSLIKHYFNRLDKLGIDRDIQEHIIPHISLMELYINMDNPDHKIIINNDGSINSKLLQIMKQQYLTINPQMHIVSKTGKYEIMGDFMAKVYTAVNSDYITQLRIVFYKYIESILGDFSRKSIIISNKKYYVYSYGGRELIAIPHFYHGKGVWKPHLSLIKMSKLQLSNPVLYSSYEQYGINVLIDALRGVKGSMNQLNLARHFNSFRITVV